MKFQIEEPTNKQVSKLAYIAGKDKTYILKREFINKSKFDEDTNIRTWDIDKPGYYDVIQLGGHNYYHFDGLFNIRQVDYDEVKRSL